MCLFVCLAVTAIDKNKTDGVIVLGVTSVDDELFVLLGRNNNQVAVYSINDYQLLRHLNVPDVNGRNLRDMTSCVRHKCLYMSDYDNKCIHRYDLASSATSKSSLPGKPCGLSVTPSCNLLVTCQWPHKLVVLSKSSHSSLFKIKN